MCKAFSTNTNTTHPTSGGVSSVGGDRHFNNAFPGDIRRACVGQWCPMNLGFAGTVARIRFTVTESIGLASFRTSSSEVSLTLLKFASLGGNDGKLKTSVSFQTSSSLPESSSMTPTSSFPAQRSHRYQSSSSVPCDVIVIQELLWFPAWSENWSSNLVSDPKLSLAGPLSRVIAGCLALP